MMVNSVRRGRLGTLWIRYGMCALLVSSGPSSALLALSAPAAAQTADELDRARNLFRQGVSLEAAGNWAGALAKFQEVSRVKLTPQVRFHVARCKENLGRLNEALGDYRLAEYEAEQQELKELSEITAAREQLEQRVPTLHIVRGEGAEFARISLDGVELGERQITQPVSVDPGPHTVAAKLPGDVQYERSVTVQEGDKEEVILSPPPELLAKGKKKREAKVAAAAPPPSEPKQSAEPAALPWVIGGIGVAGLAASGVFFAMRKGAESDLDDVCRGNVCPESARGTQEDGELYSTLTMVGLGVGVVGIGVATYLLVSGDSGDAAAEHARANEPVGFDVAVGPSQGSVTVRGTF